MSFSLRFLCFLKYSFNANKTHNCILKMNIIALFLHILWDRKCKVTDSRFRSRDSDLFLLSNGPGFRSPQLTQKRGSAHSRGAGALRGRTHTQPTHAHCTRNTLGRSPARFLSCGTHGYTQHAKEPSSVTHLCKTLSSALLITFKLENQTKTIFTTYRNHNKLLGIRNVW